MTRYKILIRGPVDTSWYEKDEVAARSTQAAIRTYLDGKGETEDNFSFVAVPSRSWKPVTVKVETKTALKFS